MSLFSAIVDAGTSLTQIAPSAPVPTPDSGPLPRFAGEPVRWVAAPSSANVFAFARSAVRVFAGASKGIPDDSASSWTLIEISPLPAFAAKVLLVLPGGLPVQYVILSAQATATATDNTRVSAGAAIAKAGSGSGASVWFGICQQDRIVRDPTLWSGQIAAALSAAGADALNWTAFAAALAGLGAPARAIYLLDHIGHPLQSGTFTITTDAGSASVTLNGASDGNTGVSLSVGGQAGIAFASATHPLVAGAEFEGGNFDAPYQLAPGERHAQATDAETWFADRDAGVTGGLARWNPNSFVEPIVDGNPYYARLVPDLRSTKGGGGAGLAGWAFIKSSLLDSTLAWDLIPGQDDTQFVPLVKELVAGGSQIRLLVTQFLQFTTGTFDDTTAALAILWALFAANFPLTAFRILTTDPAGFGVLLGALTVADFLMASPFTLDVLQAIGEPSRDVVNDLTLVSPDLVRWSRYPAATADNPFFSPPLSLAGVTIDDINQFGLFHQKFVVGKSAAGEFFSYLGGIDINSNRTDSPLHRVAFPYHDLQARITGPAVKDVIRTFADRCVSDQVTPPFDVPASPPQLPPGQGRHLVQIARTYYRPKTGTGLRFAPQGETLIYRTQLQAINAARDFIYLEDQYFTPDDQYVQTLIGAANHAKALIITVCMQNGQTFGPIRRTDIISALRAAWGTRIKVGALLRRFLDPTPAKTVNLGRCVLKSAITASSTTITIGPGSHVPNAPFWAFVENELLQVMAPQGPPDAEGNQAFFVTRGPVGSLATWGAKVDRHGEKSPVMCVRIPNIYVHAKLLIVDDIFLSVGSANLNRRGFFHDGEINALLLPQHLKRDPTNPASTLRCRIWADHMGLTPEMGLSLFSDPLSALPYFDRSWFAGNRWQPLAWSGSETDTLSGFGSSDSIGAELLQLAVGGTIEHYKDPLWPVLVDPTCISDPSPRRGPEYP